MGETGTAPASARPASPKFRMHWHVVLSHLPTAAFAGVFLFMLLHLLTLQPCYSLAAYVTLVGSTALLVPTTITGWFTWKRRYKGSKSRLFLTKIRIAAALVPVSLALVVYKTIYPFTALDVTHRFGHAIYFAGIFVLMVGGFAEGFWGGRLHHR